MARMYPNARLLDDPYDPDQLAGGGLSKIRNTELIVRYPPAARRYRGVVRANLQGLGCPCRSSGLSDAAQVTGAASTAASGAKLGTMIMPGIGTAIGAVVGAVVGIFLGKKKPVRASAEFIAQCGQAFSEYQSLIAQYPNTPLGFAIGEGNLKVLATCMDNRYGGTKDPRFLDANWQILRDSAVEAVKKTFAAPAGTEVLLSTAGRRDAKGKAFRLVETRWTNTEANSLQSIADRLWQFMSAGCLAYHKSNVCSGIVDHADYKHLMLDLIQWAAMTYLPQIEVPAEPTAPIAQQPPAPPTTVVPVPAAAVPPGVAPPAVTVPTLPPNASNEQIHSAITQLTATFLQTQQAQSMSQQQAAAAASAAAQQWLASQGIRAAPAAVDQTAQSAVTQAGGLGNLMPLLLGFGALVFALASPSRVRVRYRSTARRARR